MTKNVEKSSQTTDALGSDSKREDWFGETLTKRKRPKNMIHDDIEQVQIRKAKISLLCRESCTMEAGGAAARDAEEGGGAE